MINRIILDISIFILMVELLKRYILKKELTEDDNLFLQHTNPIFIYFILLLMGVGIICSILNDFEENDCSILAHMLPIVGFYILALKLLYIRYIYGSKEWKYVERTKLGFISIIFLMIIFIGLYIF